MSKILAAIAKITGDVGAIKKDGYNKFHQYDYTSAAEVQHRLQPLLAREGLVILQNEIHRDLTADGTALAVTYEFILAHESGDIYPDRLLHTGIAAARNTKGGFDDKAGNKCHTAARKYFLLGLFQIPTGVPDADADEDKPPPGSAIPIDRGLTTSATNTVPLAPRTITSPLEVREQFVAEKVKLCGDVKTLLDYYHTLGVDDKEQYKRLFASRRQELEEAA